jgi:hypothetical protein
MSLLHEQTLSLSEASARVPSFRAHHKTHVSTVVRWITKGALAPDGQRVRLQAARIGGRWITSVEALERFIHALTPAAKSADTPRQPTSRQQASRQQAVDRQLDALGI